MSYEEHIALTEKLYSSYMDTDVFENEFSVFLCGGNDSVSGKIRKQVGKILSSLRSHYIYTPYYPEEMFIELALGHYKKDFLSLENLLAKSVSSVAILLNSPGTFAELGAFANHSELAEKLIVLINRKYRKDKSFINLGPVRHLLQKTTSEVHWVEMTVDYSRTMAKHIAKSTRLISKEKPPVQDLTNPVWSLQFYLAAIYVLAPVTQNILASAAAHICPGKDDHVNLVLEATINTLVNKGYVIRTPNGLSTTNAAHERMYIAGSKISKFRRQRIMKELRFSALNKLYRGTIWKKGRQLTA